METRPAGTFRLDPYPASVRDVAVHAMSFRSVLVLLNTPSQARTVMDVWKRHDVQNAWLLTLDDGRDALDAKLRRIRALLSDGIPVMAAATPCIEDAGGLDFPNVIRAVTTEEHLERTAALKGPYHARPGTEPDPDDDDAYDRPIEVFVPLRAVADGIGYDALLKIHGTLANAGFDMSSAKGIGMYAVQLEAWSGRDRKGKTHEAP